MGARACVLAAGLGLASVFFGPEPAGAAGSAIALGRVSVRVQRADHELTQRFRRAVAEELSRIDVRNVKSREKFVLSASLTRMETRSDQARAEATCVVSATLTREGGALHAIIEGRARAEDAPRAKRSAELSALQAAVRSAVGRVASAI